MMIELESSFWNRTGKQNDKSARGHETAPDQSFLFVKEVSCPDTLVLYDLSALEVARKM